MLLLISTSSQHQVNKYQLLPFFFFTIMNLSYSLIILIITIQRSVRHQQLNNKR